MSTEHLMRLNWILCLQKKGQPPALMQEDSWARPPGQQGHAEWSAWLDKHRLDKDHLTVSLATLCDLVKRELEGDLAIHRAHVLPASVILPVRVPFVS